MNAPFDFSGKVALVTGSSRGIGAGIITALGQHGAKCVVNYVSDPEGRNQADAEKIAGILRDRTIKKMSTEEWETVLRVNLTGAFNCIHHAHALLRPKGRVVNISSVAA